MYLLVPFSLIVISAAGIAFIVYRKMPYLKKLTPESHELSDNIFYDFFPEIAEHVNEAKFKEYQKALLRETEKLVRRLRVATLKIDHLSDRLIKKLRREHIAANLKHQALLEERKEDTTPVAAEANRGSSQEELKAREQQLIIEIAKNPKEPALYIELGDLYLAMHNIEEARESFEAALALTPNDAVLVRKYSQLIKKTESVS
ncbi:MAG: hypothetical protein A2941_02460 [Candidatus Yanofskybacteria bacterium RIFCSPLOWO2_01_FULL_49_17]|uniref:Uncharacterized protein n=1 Tax=Candidatus Yanofskybacteria bacterium RIFCSPLOWO2_01_FULL_49_17 TaxID=1802700 RepID=A0A1F8GRU6_9BACT|nr:MAG: hypothetical protein A2941_02460 [Candidatus Yanofskybacteria bacterium RIFCSPLOWO2_01_FULL_49_17]